MKTSTGVYGGEAIAAGRRVSYELETPFDEHCNIPVVLVPGFLESGWGLRDARHEIVTELKRPAVTVNFGSPGIKRGQALGAIMDELGYPGYALMLHSRGGTSLPELSDANLKRIQAVALMASSGLIEGDTAIAVSGRIVASATEEYLLTSAHNPIKAAQLGWRALLYMAQNPLTTFIEGCDTACADIKPQIGRLQKFGVTTTATVFSRDSVYPPDLVADSSEHLFGTGMFTEHPDPTLRHLAPEYNPSSVIDIINHLHQKTQAS